MFDEEDAPKPPVEFPRNLETLSIEELRGYIEELKAEIARVEGDIAAKHAATAAAGAFFKT